MGIDKEYRRVWVIRYGQSDQILKKQERIRQALHNSNNN